MKNWWKSPNGAVGLKALLRLWAKTLFLGDCSPSVSFKISSSVVQARSRRIRRDGKSTKTRISLSSSRRTVSASCARNNAECVIRAPPPRSDLAASSTVRRSRAPQPSAVPLKSRRHVFVFFFLCLSCASLRLIEPCPQWSELTWERITDALTLRSAAWRRVRSTRSEEPATSFAFLQPLPSMGFQPIRANEHSSGVGRTPFKVAPNTRLKFFFFFFF